MKLRSFYVWKMKALERRIQSEPFALFLGKKEIKARLQSSGCNRIPAAFRQWRPRWFKGSHNLPSPFFAILKCGTRAIAAAGAGKGESAARRAGNAAAFAEDKAERSSSTRGGFKNRAKLKQPLIVKASLATSHQNEVKSGTLLWFNPLSKQSLTNDYLLEGSIQDKNTGWAPPAQSQVILTAANSQIGSGNPKWMSEQKQREPLFFLNPPFADPS